MKQCMGAGLARRSAARGGRDRGLWRSGGCERGKERPKGINGSGSRVGVNYKAEAEHGDGDSWRQDGDIYVNVRATTEGQAT